MPVGQAHRQGRRVLAGVGGMHLMGRDLGRTAARQVGTPESTLLRGAWQGMGGNRNDEASIHERRPQPVEVLVTRQVRGLQGGLDLWTDCPIISGEG